MFRVRIIVRYIVFLGCIALANQISAQIIDADTITVIENNAEEEELHSPRKATMYSAILPGLGQAYNKKYWKIPLVYGGFFAIGYFIDWNNDYYQLYRTAYNHWTDDDDSTTDYMKIEAIRLRNPDITNSTDFANIKEGLSLQQSYFRRNRDLLIISMVGFYGLNIIDAGVDAHLFDFDISDDLTFNWQPYMLNINNQNIYCINCTFSF